MQGLKIWKSFLSFIQTRGLRYALSYIIFFTTRVTYCFAHPNSRKKNELCISRNGDKQLTTCFCSTNLTTCWTEKGTLPSWRCRLQWKIWELPAVLQLPFSEMPGSVVNTQNQCHPTLTSRSWDICPRTLQISNAVDEATPTDRNGLKQPSASQKRTFAKVQQTGLLRVGESALLSLAGNASLQNYMDARETKV